MDGVVSQEGHQFHRLRCGFFAKRCANFLLIFLVISPATIAFWRGTWLLMDLYFYHDNQALSAWVSTGLGLSFSFAFVLLQDLWRKLLIRCSSPLNAFMWRIFTYPLGFCVVSAWRGVWMLLGSELLENTPTLNAGISHFLGFLVLLLTRSTSTVVFTPGFTLSDRFFVPEELKFLSYSCLALEEKLNRVVLNIWNCFFTVFVVGTAGVACWRGAWTLLDIWTLPPEGGDRFQSTILSLCLGYTIVIGCYCICESIPRKIDLPLSLFCQMIEQVFIYIIIIGDINIWRALFYLQDDYILRDNVIGSAWLSHTVGFVVLLFGQGLVNLIGSPICCNVTRPGARENFYMGEYLDLTGTADCGGVNNDTVNNGSDKKDPQLPS